MKSDLELRYRNMSDDDLLAVIHSPSFRSEAQALARELLLDRGLSESAMGQWRDPNAAFAEPLYLDDTPLRILFLRPFGLRDSGDLARSFVRRYLNCIGHTYTLSDTEIKPWQELPHIFKFLLLVIGAPWLILWHPRSSFNVQYHEDIPRFLDYMSRRVARMIVWMLPDKIFKVTCTQETWKRVVQYLINRVNLVVVDLSHSGEGLKWELEELLFYNAIDKTVFVARESSINFASLFLKSCGLSIQERRLFAYMDDGLATRHEDLKAALASTVAYYNDI
jgi:hypothetical protein